MAEIGLMDAGATSSRRGFSRGTGVLANMTGNVMTSRPSEGTPAVKLAASPTATAEVNSAIAAVSLVLCL
jgi:hypothetical protein